MEAGIDPSTHGVAPVPTRRGARRHVVAAVAALAALGMLGAACSSSSTSSTGPGDSTPPGTPLVAEGNANMPKAGGTPTDGGTLRFAVGGEPDGYNPVGNNFALDANMIASAVYDPLLRINEKREVEPYLAESVTPNADATVWTITARPNVTFHDGTPFDGKAIFLNVDGRVKTALNAIALEPVKEVVQTGPMTVEVRMKKPWAAYNYTLAAQGGYMAAPSMLDGTGDPATPIGTGPFTWTEYTVGKGVKLAKNATYWRTGEPHLDGIDFRIITDQTARSQALRAGDIDAMITERAADVETFRTEKGFVQAEDLAAEESFIMLNQAAPPFDNLDARLALAYATDRQAIIDVQTNGLAPDADQPFVESEFWYVPDAGYVDYDPAKAQEHLDKYKAATGASSLTFEVKGPASELQTRLTQQLQQQWKALGIDATINLTEQATFLKDAIVGKYQASFFRNFAYVDPDSNYIFWSSSTAKGIGTLSINFTQTKDAELDAALDAGRATTDRQQRKQAYATVVKRINAVVPYIWLYHNLWAIAASDKVGGLDAAQKVGFARQDAKPWWGQLWLQK